MFLLQLSVTLERSAKLRSAWPRAGVCLQSFGVTATCKVAFSAHTSHHHAHIPRFFWVKINFLSSPSGKNAQSPRYFFLYFQVFYTILVPMTSIMVGQFPFCSPIWLLGYQF